MLVSVQGVVLLVVVQQVELVVEVVHVLVVFLVPVYATEFAGGGTIACVAASSASGSSGAFIGSISGVYASEFAGLGTIYSGASDRATGRGFM